jgi:hypothetical protein
MRRWSFLLATVMLLGFPGSGLADKKAVMDPDDVMGSLDISKVGHGHGANGKLVHTIETFATWPPELLEPQETWLALLFDVDRDRDDPFGENRYLRIDYTQEDGLTARMYTQGIGGPAEFIADVPVSRPTEASVRVVFSKKLLAKKLKEYRWRAIASFEDDSECSSDDDNADQGGCLDYVPPPTKPGIRHDLR